MKTGVAPWPHRGRRADVQPAPHRLSQSGICCSKQRQEVTSGPGDRSTFDPRFLTGLSAV